MKERKIEFERKKTNIIVRRNDILIPHQNPDHVSKENINFDVHTKSDPKINLKTIIFFRFLRVNEDIRKLMQSTVVPEKSVSFGGTSFT